MDDSSTANVGKSEGRIPFCMPSFDLQEREQFGQKIRLTMACIDGTSEPVQDYCHGGIRDRLAPLFIFEASAYFAINARRVPNILCH